MGYSCGIDSQQHNTTVSVSLTPRNVTKTPRSVRSGDSRVNEHVGLMCMHTLLAREHNRVESVLHYLNRHWDGHRLFEESRRIVIAEWQHLIYNEWLPIILGERIMRDNQLTLVQQGFWNGRDAAWMGDCGWFGKVGRVGFRLLLKCVFWSVLKHVVK